jgi:hypothetical protein
MTNLVYYFFDPHIWLAALLSGPLVSMAFAAEYILNHADQWEAEAKQKGLKS